MISLVYMIYVVSSNTLCCFSHSKTVGKQRTCLRKNHMNHDVVEVNSSNPPMLPSPFLYEKEPGYEAMCQLLLNKPHNGHLAALFLMRNSSKENWSVLLGSMEKKSTISLWEKFVAYH